MVITISFIKKVLNLVKQMKMFFVLLSIILKIFVLNAQKDLISVVKFVLTMVTIMRKIALK